MLALVGTPGEVAEALRLAGIVGHIRARMGAQVEVKGKGKGGYDFGIGKGQPNGKGVQVGDGVGMDVVGKGGSPLPDEAPFAEPLPYPFECHAMASSRIGRDCSPGSMSRCCSLRRRRVGHSSSTSSQHS